jgi:hypothetical protein
VRLKKTSTGKRSLVVDGAAIRVDEAVIFVGDTPLGALKFPAGRRNADGTASRVVSKDSRLKSLIGSGESVTITIRQTRAGQISAPYSFTR